MCRKRWEEFYFSLLNVNVAGAGVNAQHRASVPHFTLDRAVRTLQVALDIEHRQWQIGSHCTLGFIYRDLLTFPEARRHLEQALTLAQAMNATWWMRPLNRGLGPVSPAEVISTEVKASAP